MTVRFDREALVRSPLTGCRLVAAVVLSLGLAACGGRGGGGGEGGGGGATNGGASGSGGAGGGTSAPPPAPPITKNLTATALQVLTSGPRIAYPLTVSVSISASEATDDVSVSLFAIQDSSDPNADIRQLPLGTQTIARVEPGARSYEVATTIPSSVEYPGRYVIAAVVDPVEEIAESNEDDNTAAVEATLAAEGGPNILLKEVALDRTVVQLNTAAYAQQVPGTPGNVHNPDAGGMVVVGADGLAVDETIDLEGFATLRLSRTDTGASHDVPLYLWSSAASRYTNAYGVTPSGVVLPAAEWLPLGEFTPQLVESSAVEDALDDLHRDSVQQNFYFPGKLGEELENGMRYPTPAGGVQTQSLPTVPPPDLTIQAISALRAFLRGLPSNGTQGDPTAALAVMRFAICFEVRPADRAIVDRTLDDNKICTPVSILLPPQSVTPPPPPPPPGFTPRFRTASSPFFTSDGFATRGGNSTFGFGIDFGASASADHRGYIEELHGGVPVTVFGSSFDFLKVMLRAQLVPDYITRPVTDSSGYRLELWFTGNLLHSVNTGAISGPEVGISYAKEIAKDAQLFIGPVPVVVGAGIAGEIGIEYEFVFTADAVAGDYAFGNSVGPYANLEGSLSVGVGTKVFSVGVEGVLTLIEDQIVLFGGAEIELIRNGQPGGAVEFVITRGLKLSNELTGPRGAFNLYAKYTVPVLKECEWGPIKGLAKCPGVKTIKATKNIWSSPSLFHLEDVIFEDNNVELDVVLVPNRNPAYYVP